MARLPKDPKIREVALATSVGDLVALYDDYPGEVYPFEIFTVKELTDAGFLYGLVYPPTRKGWKKTVENKWNRVDWDAMDEDDNVVYTSAIPKQARGMIKAIFKHIGS